MLHLLLFFAFYLPRRFSLESIFFFILIKTERERERECHRERERGEGRFLQIFQLFLVFAGSSLPVPQEQKKQKSFLFVLPLSSVSPFPPQSGEGGQKKVQKKKNCFSLMRCAFPDAVHEPPTQKNIFVPGNVNGLSKSIP